MYARAQIPWVLQGPADSSFVARFVHACCEHTTCRRGTRPGTTEPSTAEREATVTPCACQLPTLPQQHTWPCSVTQDRGAWCDARQLPAWSLPRARPGRLPAGPSAPRGVIGPTAPPRRSSCPSACRESGGTLRAHTRRCPRPRRSVGASARGRTPPGPLPDSQPLTTYAERIET